MESTDLKFGEIMYIQISAEGFTAIQANGSTLSRSEITAVCLPTHLWEVESIKISSGGDSAWCVFWVAQDSDLIALTKTTGILDKHGDDWKVVHTHSSMSVSLDEAKSSLERSRL